MQKPLVLNVSMLESGLNIQKLVFVSSELISAVLWNVLSP